MTEQSAFMSALLAILALAVAFDIRQHRVPNALTLTAVALGLSLQTMQWGVIGLKSGLAGLAVGLAAFLPGYIFRVMGAADVKLMAGVGAFLGPLETLRATAMTLVAGAVLGIVVLMVKRYAIFIPYAHSVASAYTRYARLSVDSPPLQEGRRQRRTVGIRLGLRIPYAPAIALGTIGALLWHLV